nr:glycoside hydrolase family 43 protein [Saccharopolyspora sp. HNM0983]
MSRWRRIAAALSVLPVAAGTSAPQERSASTNATYYNDARTPGADPFVLRAGGYYYAYTTEGADEGFHFGIYRSPDLATWERIPGGALPVDDPGQWGGDWFWAPEVYHNPKTGKYFMFYSARLAEGVAEHFDHPDFEEPSKIGVAVADSPTGPFRNIGDAPLDYRPYDPHYHDVNRLMDAEQKKPPETLEEGRTAPLGVYLPAIDPNVFFDDGRIFLYFSRNAYRNWVWDRGLGKYVEEADINAVELTGDWWHDPHGSTAPEIRPEYRGVHGDSAEPGRRDGFVPILDHAGDPQEWEDAHVHDYARSGGRLKDRRWAEGSSVVRAQRTDGRPLYFLTYSANNFQNASYGVGYAVAEHPLGPWRKSGANPVLHQDEQLGLYSTGHGSAVDGQRPGERYYVFHGRPAPDTDRRLYTGALHLDPDAGSLDITESTADEPVPSGVAPYEISTDVDEVDLTSGRGAVSWAVRTAGGGRMDLAHPANRVVPEIRNGEGVSLVEHGPDGAVLRGSPRDGASLVLRYQRQRADGRYVDIRNGAAPVQREVPVVGCPDGSCDPR